MYQEAENLNSPNTNQIQMEIIVKYIPKRINQATPLSIGTSAIVITMSSTAQDSSVHI